MTTGKAWHLAMARRNPPLPAPVKHWMVGDQGAVFEDRHLVGQRVHLDNPSPGGIWNAVEIAADADHSFMGDPPFQLEHGAERGERQRPQVGIFRREGFVDYALCRGVHARISDRVEPMPQLDVQVAEIAERAGEEEVLADIAIGSLDFPFVLARYGRQALGGKP